MDQFYAKRDDGIWLLDWTASRVSFFTDDDDVHYIIGLKHIPSQNTSILVITTLDMDKLKELNENGFGNTPKGQKSYDMIEANLGLSLIYQKVSDGGFNNGYAYFAEIFGWSAVYEKLVGKIKPLKSFM